MNDSTSSFMVVVRLLWIAVGPVLLLGLSVAMLSHKAASFSVYDFGIVIALCSMVAAKYVDQKFGLAMTSEGEPSTWADFRNYTRNALLFGGGLWAGAKCVTIFYLL